MSFTKFKVQLGHPNEALDCEKTTHQEFKCSEQLHHHPSLAYLTTGRKESPTYKISNAAIVPSSETDTNPAATYLKALSQTLLRIVIIDKDISNPLLKKHMSPKFSAKQDDQENSKDLSEHLSIWAEAIKSMPDYQYEIIESVAEIHESGKKADVWTFKRLSGVPVLAAPAKRGRKRQVDNGVCKESVGVSMHSLGYDIHLR